MYGFQCKFLQRCVGRPGGFPPQIPKIIQCQMISVIHSSITRKQKLPKTGEHISIFPKNIQCAIKKFGRRNSLLAFDNLIYTIWEWDLITLILIILNLVCAISARIAISSKITQPQNLPKLPKALFSMCLSQLKMPFFNLFWIHWT